MKQQNAQNSPYDDIEVNKNSSKTIVIVISIAIFAWVLSGVLLNDENSIDTISNKTTSTKLQKVRFKESLAQDHIKMIHINGVTTAFRRVDIKAEVLGRIESIHAQEGVRIKENTTILKIETRDRLAMVERAKANLEKTQIDYTASQQLKIKGFQAATNVADSLKKLEEAKAELIAAEIALKNTEIIAPFDGILNSINAEVGSLVGPGIATGIGSFNQGSSIAVVIDTNPIIVVGNVSEHNISKIKMGVPSQIKLITGQTIEGIVSYISKIADDTTRTFRIEISVENKNYTILAGITAYISIPIGHQIAHHISSSHLSLNENGQIGIKTISTDKASDKQNINGIIKFHPVVASDYDIDGIWIDSLPDIANIVTIGQAFVKDGQEVMGIKEAGNKP